MSSWLKFKYILVRVIGDLLSAKSGVNSLKEKVCFFGGHFVLESDKKLDGVGPVDNRLSTN